MGDSCWEGLVLLLAQTPQDHLSEAWEVSVSLVTPTSTECPRQPPSNLTSEDGLNTQNCSSNSYKSSHYLCPDGDACA